MLVLWDSMKKREHFYLQKTGLCPQVKGKKEGRKGGMEGKIIHLKTEDDITTISHFSFLKIFLHVKIPHNLNTLLLSELNSQAEDEDNKDIRFC